MYYSYAKFVLFNDRGEFIIQESNFFTWLKSRHTTSASDGAITADKLTILVSSWARTRNLQNLPWLESTMCWACRRSGYQPPKKPNSPITDNVLLIVHQWDPKTLNNTNRTMQWQKSCLYWAPFLFILFINTAR